ncbi:MAG TPA: hypothetical protein VFE53_02165 [Mucilaginibacter sp.]|jgi:hypothetical protein|nr:hypothetical protein [Mucilaginibacter sp.]
MSPSISNTPQFPYDRHRGPHPGILAIIYTLLFALGLVLFGILSHGAQFPRPFGPLQTAQQTFLQFPDAIRISALFQFGAAIPLGLFTAAVTSRLSFLGVNVTGVSIALFGGIAASVLFMLSGLSGWVLSQPGVANDVNVMHAIQLFGFGCGGVAFTVALGLLMAGISVPCLFGRYTPKWLAWFGLILAGIAELSTLSLVVPQATYLLPLVRFPSFIWMIWTGFTLIKNRPVSAAS